MIVNGQICGISNLQENGGVITAEIQWHPEHAVFAGHFPGQPVVPGVCMMQLVQEILEVARQQKLLLVSAANIKFLNFIDPRVHGNVNLDIKVVKEAEGLTQINANLFAGDVTFFKYQAAYRQIIV
ncbi:hypothetical protein [Flavihumibacter petaseus]|uniref:ApeI dehydratase-like domain-containing protein n=1 Tax=Flavihumibacter petaseus NBRC 106054 TaxID=1220578 RepID=A0A0E9MWW6_9BACT|nr:hypothetical protein [Flavihumibacter petaseus]GAO42079.1 hypothetical protein FPE01S_01_10920 [Flavihumibacter petaseus NBRC 106054]